MVFHLVSHWRGDFDTRKLGSGRLFASVGVICLRRWVKTWIIFFPTAG